MNNYLFFLVVLPLLASPVVYLAGRIGMYLPLYSKQHISLSRWVSLLVLIFIAIVFLRVISITALETQYYVLFGGSIEFQFDALSVLYIGIVLTLTSLVVLYSGEPIRNEIGENKYYAMLMGMMASMIGLACAGDVFNLWVWFEAMVVTSYLLVAFYYSNPGSLEACVKYLVQSAIGSALIILGIALLILESGSTDMTIIAESAEKLIYTKVIAGIFFMTGFGIKAAIFPLHTWLPDAHSQAPSGISAMLSGVVIEGGLIAILRVIGLFPNTFVWGDLMILGATFNIFIGNMLALRQEDVKRLLAYSSISHIGYMLLGLGIGLFSGSSNGLQAGLAHVINHSVMKSAAFLAVGALIFGLEIDKKDHLRIKDLRGIATSYPLVCLSLTIALLGLGGIPTLAGFISKSQIFISGLAISNGYVIAATLFAIFNTFVAIVYYLRITSVMYYAEGGVELKTPRRAIPRQIQIPILVLVLLTLLVGLIPELLNPITKSAADALWLSWSR